MEVENGYIWKETIIGGIHFWLPGSMGGRGSVSIYQPFSLINLQVRIAMYDYSPAEGEEAGAIGASEAEGLWGLWSMVVFDASCLGR